jgi:hypothetical protein
MIAFLLIPKDEKVLIVYFISRKDILFYFLYLKAMPHMVYIMREGNLNQGYHQELRSILCMSS